MFESAESLCPHGAVPAVGQLQNERALRLRVVNGDTVFGLQLAAAAEVVVEPAIL